MALSEEQREEIKARVHRNSLFPEADYDKIIPVAVELTYLVRDRVDALGKSWSFQVDDEKAGERYKRDPQEKKPWTAEEKCLLFLTIIETFAEDARNVRTEPEDHHEYDPTDGTDMRGPNHKDVG